ncbi:MAG: Acetyltransferase domain, partial [Ilumatobacteraceae bacterium]
MSEHSPVPRSVDRLVARTLAAFPFRFTVAQDDTERLVAYRLRQAIVIERGWGSPNAPSVDTEEDAYDHRAVHVIGWHDDTPVSTGRIVLPPGLLPTEEVCALRIEPRGGVVDVGRMVVAPSHRGPHGGAFVALMARLYLEVRKQGYTVACGMMAPDVRHLVRQLGVQLDVLGPDRTYW